LIRSFTVHRRGRRRVIFPPSSRRDSPSAGHPRGRAAWRPAAATRIRNGSVHSRLFLLLCSAEAGRALVPKPVVAKTFLAALVNPVHLRSGGRAGAASYIFRGNHKARPPREFPCASASPVAGTVGLQFLAAGCCLIRSRLEAQRELARVFFRVSPIKL